MLISRKIGLLLLSVFAFITSHAQEAAAIDSIKLALAGVTSSLVSRAPGIKISYF